MRAPEEEDAHDDAVVDDVDGGEGDRARDLRELGLSSERLRGEWVAGVLGGEWVVRLSKIYSRVHALSK